MKLYVGGLGLRGDGYPNSARTVRLLEQQADIEIVHCERWLPVDLHLWKLARMPRWRALRWLLVLAPRQPAQPATSPRPRAQGRCSRIRAVSGDVLPVLVVAVSARQTHALHRRQLHFGLGFDGPGSGRWRTPDPSVRGCSNGSRRGRCGQPKWCWSTPRPIATTSSRSLASIPNAFDRYRSRLQKNHSSRLANARGNPTHVFGFYSSAP